MVAALRLMPTQPLDLDTVDAHAFAALRSRYQAVVHERDALLTRLERHEHLEQATLTCDAPACHSTLVMVAAFFVEQRLLELAAGKGWSLSDGHRCPACSGRP